MISASELRFLSHRSGSPDGTDFHTDESHQAAILAELRTGFALRQTFFPAERACFNKHPRPRPLEKRLRIPHGGKDLIVLSFSGVLPENVALDAGTSNLPTLSAVGVP